MKLNYDDEQRKPLKPGALNETKQDNETTMQQDEDHENDAGADEKRRKYIKYGIIGGVATIIVVLAIVLPLTLGGGGKPTPPTPPPVPPVFPQNENPYFVIVQTERNTAYSRSGLLEFIANKNDTARVEDFVNEDTKRILLGDVQATSRIGVNWTQTLKIGPNNQIKKNLRYSFDMVDFKVARFELTDAQSDRFTIPDDLVERPDTNKNLRLDMVGHFFKPTLKRGDQPFSFQFHDNLRPENIYVTNEGQSLIFADKYIQMDFVIPSTRIYGFGERLTTFNLGEGAWGMWGNGAADHKSLDNARGRGGQYGVHPFILVRSHEAQKYFGMYFRNANAQLPIIRKNSGGASSSTLSYITLGGQIEVYFFISGTAREVVADFHKIFGKPHLPPFWALGWQEASQTAYNDTINRDNQLNLLRTVTQYRARGYPLDAVYLDRDQESKVRNFALNSDLIPNATALKQDLNAFGVKLVAYINPTIFAPDNVTAEFSKNPAYIEGNRTGLFIKSTHTPSVMYSGNLVALHNLKKCVYIDWFKSADAFRFWNKNLQIFHKEVDFDGVWTSENEAFTEIQGEINIDFPVKRSLEASVNSNNLGADFDTTWFDGFNASSQSTYNLPFIPEFKTRGAYDNYSISLNGTHKDFVYYNSRKRDFDKRDESEYNLHSLYGAAMIKTTYQALNDISFFNNSLRDHRQFIVTRSTFTGTNQYASYPIQYKYRNWDSLRLSISHVMNMNMFGFAHTGVDACGQIDLDQTRTSMDEELCLRWIQLSTFFPLARHSQKFTAKESYLTGPLAFKEGSANEKALKKTLRDRMQYLRFMYTCLFEASRWGGSCFDPLFYHYSLDVKSTEDVQGANDTFIFGGAVKVSPILYSLDTSINKTFKSHFPKGRWLNLANWKVDEATEDGLIDLDATLETVNAHLKPGSLIPMNDLSNTSIPALNTQDVLGRPINIVINRNENKVAKGTVFLDDGITKSELTNKTYEYYSIEHKASKAIQFSLIEGKRAAQDDRHHIDEIVIGDAKDLEDTDFACAYTSRHEIIELEAEFDKVNNVLRLSRPEIYDDTRIQFSKVQNIYYGNSKKDLELCRANNFQYKLDPATDLTKILQQPSATMRLIHKAGILPDLSLTVRMFDEGIVNVKWTWFDEKNGRRPHPEVPEILVNTSRASPLGTQVGRHVIIQADPFVIQFTVQQFQTAPLFEIDRFVYDSYLNWVSMTALSTFRDESHRGVMGLGERSQDSLFYKDGVYSMWAYDSPLRAEDGEYPGKNGYGVHPFFMFQHSANKWVGVFSKQAHAQDWIIENRPKDGKTFLTQVSTGGQSDFYIIINSNTPDSVVGYYQRIVGKPVLMPQWSLGWHQCKFCLRSVQEYQWVVGNYSENKIPLDVQWADIDYMKDYQNFRVDSLYFGDLTTYVNELYHNATRGIKFVPIVDAAIAARPDKNYTTYLDGEKQGVFLKSAADGKTLIGRSWASHSAFPDFFAPNAKTWWHNELTQFRDNQIWFDGLWLDMNEASNFCNGACLERQQVKSSVADKFHHTPSGRSLEDKSLPLDTVHADTRYTQLDTHNYFGAHQIALTHDWFMTKSIKRPFIVGRSTFAGTGKYAGKWLGDSGSTYAEMQRSVTGSMMMNVLGIPYVGGDICGFMGENSSPELCTRWHQVGAFQPFSRNHRDCDGRPQEPYRFMNNFIANGTISMMNLMKKAINEKYSLIRYYYTHLFLLSQDNSANGAFYKPVFFEFPDLDGAYRANPSENVMIGSSLKLSIKTSMNKNWDNEKHDFYFPAGKWCDILHPETECVLSIGDEMRVLPAGLKDYQLHLRDGHIIPFQNASALGISTSEDLQKYPVDFHINPKNMTTTNTTRKYSASGVYVNDDGNSRPHAGTFNKYQLSFTYNDIVDGKNDDETIILRITLKDQASRNFTNETRCSTINKNDILGSIVIYDDFNMFQRTMYHVYVLRPDATIDRIGTAVFDMHTSRMIYTGADRHADVPEVCLTYVEEIIFSAA